MFTRTPNGRHVISAAGTKIECSEHRTQYANSALALLHVPDWARRTAYLVPRTSYIGRGRRTTPRYRCSQHAPNPPFHNSNPPYFCKNRTQVNHKSRTILHSAQSVAPTFCRVSARTPAAKLSSFAFKNRLRTTPQKPPTASLLAPNSSLLATA